MYANGKKEGTSLNSCQYDTDCFDTLNCKNGMCTDDQGNVEANRVVQTCVSPKAYALSDLAGCGTSDGDKILECHKWWIGNEGMEWRDYLQYN